MKRILLSMSLLLASLVGICQTISYTVRPVNFQLYPRNTSTNNATIVISGSVTSPGATLIKIRVFRNGIYAFETATSAATVGSNFNFDNISIPAEMAQYRFVPALEIGGVFADQLPIADNVVAGDAIIIQGQSNAGASENWSGDPVTPAYNNAASAYIRVLGSANPSLSTGDVAGLQWYVGDGNANPEDNGNVGQWGYVLANRLITQTTIPIAVFNGAHGGQVIDFFKKSHDPTSGSNLNNYTRLLARVQKGGFLNAIRAIFWFQGESDADDFGSPPVEDGGEYKAVFEQMYANWKADYATPGQMVYINQIRHGCNGDPERTKFINEALRQVYLDHPLETRIYGTGALQQEPDGDEGPGAPKYCHFEFVGGYEKLGNDWYPVVLSDLYDEPLPANSLSPFVISINKPSENQITLTLANSDPLTLTNNAIGNAIDNFTFEGAASQPTINYSFSGRTITLDLSTFPIGTTGLSYYDRDNHRGEADPDIVTTTNKLALVNFTNQAIILGAFPVKLLSFGGLWKNANEIDLNWSVTDEKDMTGYEIMYSTDGSSFRKIGFSKASNLPLIKQYSFKHVATLAPVNYYRLKMLDIDGTVTYSAIINIKNKEAVKSFAVSVNPNPVINDAQIYIQSEKAEKAEIVIANGMGQQVAFFSRNIQQGLSTITVSKNKLTGKGVYFVRVKMAEKTVTTKFFIAN